MKQMMITAMLAGVMAASTAAFGEDAYIENTGGQYVNTGYCVCTNTRIEIDFQMMEVGLDKQLLSSYTGNVTGYKDNIECSIYLGGTASNVRFSIYTHTNGVYGSSISALRNGKNVYPADTNRHVIVMDYTLSTNQFQVWTGDRMVGSYSYPSFLDNHRSSVPLALFGRCYRNSGIYSQKTSMKDSMFAYPSKMRVYRLKFYEGGSASENLVMDLVPHVKGGVAGFKDLCKPGRFVQGEIDGACTAGGDVTEEPDDLYIYTPRNTLSALSGKSVFLDTGYYVKPTTRVELDFAMLTADWATNKLYNISPYLIGASGNNPAFYFYAAGDVSTNGFFRYGIGKVKHGDLKECGIDKAYNIRRTVSMNSNSVSIITAGYTNWTETVAASMAITAAANSYTLKIGSSYSGVSRFLPMKVYGLKIYESDELVKDYLPFYRNGVAGLTNSLDTTDILTSRTLAASGVISDGKGTNVVFEAGGNVTDDPIEKEAYLEFDGVTGHSIKTDLYVTSNTCVEADFSLWSSTRNGDKTPGQDIFAYGNSTNYNCLYLRFGFEKKQQSFYCYFHDYIGGIGQSSAISTGVAINHERRQVKIDGLNGNATLTTNGTTVNKNLAAKSKRNLTDTSRQLYIGGSYTGTTRPAWMKLYRFKVSEAGEPVRDFVPCTHEGQAGLYDLLHGGFYPLTGGKVYGKGYSGQSDTFKVALPQTAKITKGTGDYELTCIAPGASSFEWYEDGKLIDDATTDSYTVEWTYKAPHMRTYKVVPVYTVFNEKVRGEASEAQVEISPFGLIFGVQ